MLTNFGLYVKSTANIPLLRSKEVYETSDNRATDSYRSQTDRPRGGQSTVADGVVYFDRRVNVFRHILMLKLFYTSADERTLTGQLISSS